MIKSMTGWGEARGESNGVEIRAEIKSVNNRHLDCSVKLPRQYLAAEESLKTAVSRRVSRGKVDVFITVDHSKTSAAQLKVNLDMVRAYLNAAREIADAFGTDAKLSAYELLRMPDVMTQIKDDDDTAAVIETVISVLNSALEVFDLSREREGSRLSADITERLQVIENIVGIVEERSPVTVAEYRRKLETRLREILQDKSVDETRLLTEAAIFADRTAVNEETVRLRSHVQEMYITLERGGSVGRRLDFLVQEANREANTIGSKVNDAELARYVVDLKAEIEKIREQAQNIE